MLKMHCLVFISALVLNLHPLLAQVGSNQPAPRLGKASSNENSASKQLKGNPKDEQKGTESLPLIVQVKPRPSSDIEAAEKKAKDEADASTKWWGIGLGLLGLGIASGQTYIFRRQLKVFSNQEILMTKQLDYMRYGLAATNEGLAETRRSIDVSINAQRAWVIDEIRQMETLPNPNEAFAVYLTFKNFGGIPAQIMRLKIRFHTFRLEETDPLVGVDTLPEFPAYDDEQIFFEIGDRGVILAPNQSLTVAQRFQEYGGRWTDFLDLFVVSKQMRLCCYGLISYTDGFETLRTNQFCYIWDPGFDPKGVIPNFRRFGPSHYNHAT